MKLIITMTTPISLVECPECDNKEFNYDLDGTTWKIVEDRIKYTAIFQKTTLNFVGVVVDEDGKEIRRESNGEYTYIPPVITITIHGSTESGVIKDNMLSIGNDMKYIKQ